MLHQVAKDGRRLVINVGEQLIYSDTGRWAKLLQEVAAAEPESCELDLDGLDHIDSSGLRMIVLLQDKCRELKSALTVRNAKGQVRDMLLHCRLDLLLKIE